MRWLILPLLLSGSGCGFYTMETDCAPRPEEASEVDGDMIAIESLQSAKKIAPLEGATSIEAEDGTRREVMKPDDKFETKDGELTLRVGLVTLRMRTPGGPGAYRLEELGARYCESKYVGGTCISPRGTVDVTELGPDSIDIAVRVDEAPVDDGPALRGSVRLLFKRWQHEVCTPRREGSNSAFAIRY